MDSNPQPCSKLHVIQLHKIKTQLIFINRSPAFVAQVSSAGYSLNQILSYLSNIRPIICYASPAWFSLIGDTNEDHTAWSWLWRSARK